MRRQEWILLKGEMIFYKITQFSTSFSEGLKEMLKKKIVPFFPLLSGWSLELEVLH